jgi:hypothetical protein
MINVGVVLQTLWGNLPFPERVFLLVVGVVVFLVVVGITAGVEREW